MHLDRCAPNFEPRLPANGIAMTPNEGPVLTKPDWLRLDAMTRSLREYWGPHGNNAGELERRMRCATVVAATDVGADVVTMNSRVRVRMPCRISGRRSRWRIDPTRTA